LTAALIALLRKEDAHLMLVRLFSVLLIQRPQKLLYSVGQTR
jgi:hypothetical protein